MAFWLTTGRAAALSCLLVLAACQRAPDAPTALPFKGIDITGAEYARNLPLIDVATGKPYELAAQKGRVTAVFFGYTQCPDVCPTTMAELAAVKQQLGPAGERLQGVFVSVDPARDTAELLKAYVANFGPAFTALRGDDAQTKAAAQEFKVFYGKVPGKTEGSYTVDHTAGIYVFDTQARVRLFVRHGSNPELLTHDLKLLLAAAGP